VTYIPTYVDARITDWLMRLDAGTAILMALLSVHFWVIAWKERDHGYMDRPLQGVVLIALLTGWISVELFWISMSRAAIINGEATAQFISSNIRLLVPIAGLAIAVFSVWWSSEVRPWQVVVGYAAATTILLWPDPYEAIALWAYGLLATGGG
jgi:hypothetical protein